MATFASLSSSLPSVRMPDHRVVALLEVAYPWLSCPAHLIVVRLPEESRSVQSRPAAGPSAPSRLGPGHLEQRRPDRSRGLEALAGTRPRQVVVRAPAPVSGRRRQEMGRVGARRAAPTSEVRATASVMGDGRLGAVATRRTTIDIDGGRAPTTPMGRDRYAIVARTGDLRGRIVVPQHRAAVTPSAGIPAQPGAGAVIPASREADRRPAALIVGRMRVRPGARVQTGRTNATKDRAKAVPPAPHARTTVLTVRLAVRASPGRALPVEI